ncbi:MAG TPA: PaaI family thioesterase [Burkholderiales bacterium]|nr:PaaI family thioesterase [Burkholderiales bacterium]
MPRIPEGFHRIERLSPFNALVGPLYERRDGEAVSIGLAIEAKHTNSRGICHGGVLATLADLALGYAMLAKSGESGGQKQGSFLTVHLAVDYAGAARAGDWIESKVEIQRVGSRLAFANCYLVVNEKPIVRASAIFARDGKSE